MTKQLTKRDMLRGAGTLGLSAFAVRVTAAEAVTPALRRRKKKADAVKKRYAEIFKV
jgi:hypothetical protein